MALDQGNLFKYEPLSSPSTEIRLITNLIAGEEGRLELVIEHVKLSEAKYQALSYTWGPELPVHQITINGKQTSVRTNLHDFLTWRSAAKQASEGQTEPLALWIDAICIDQANNSEKSEQVRLMGKVFSQAKVVLIWLDDNSQESAMIDLYRVHQEKHANKIAIEDWFIQVFDRGNTPCKLCKKLSWDWFDMNFSQAWEMEIKHIDWNNYWRRLWVIQEMILAGWSTKLILGGMETCSAEVYFGLHGHVSLRYPISVHLEHIRKLLQSYRERKTPYGSSSYLRRHSLSAAVELCWKQKCTDRKDKVFGLLGLTESAASFEVDYNMSIGRLLYETLKVYTQETIQTERLLWEVSDEEFETHLAIGKPRNIASLWFLFDALGVTFQDVIECYSHQKPHAQIDVLGYRYNWQPITERQTKYPHNLPALYKSHIKLSPCISFKLENTETQIPPAGHPPPPDHQVLILAYDNNPKEDSPIQPDSPSKHYCTTELALNFGQWGCSCLINEVPDSDGPKLVGLCRSFAWSHGPHSLQVYLVIKLSPGMSGAFEKQFDEKDRMSNRPRRDRMHANVECSLYEAACFQEMNRVFSDVLDRREKAEAKSEEKDVVQGQEKSAGFDSAQVATALSADLQMLFPQHLVKSVEC